MIIAYCRLNSIGLQTDFSHLLSLSEIPSISRSVHFNNVNNTTNFQILEVQRLCGKMEAYVFIHLHNSEMCFIKAV